MRFGILGPVRAVRADGSPAPLGGPKSRALLTLLLADAGRIVPTERLIDGVYGAEPPDGVGNALQSQVSRLRQQLGGGSELVEFHPAGYRLAVDPAGVDAHRFERLAAEGRKALAAGEPRAAAKLLGEALALWRGDPLADAPLAEHQATRLAELRLSATEDDLQARLELGEHAELVPRLRELVAAHPLREGLRGQLMRALHGSGRHAEALAAFEDARRTLAEELGADPSAELAAVHLALLRDEPAPAAGLSPLPAQLTSFVGRTEDLVRLSEILDTQRLVTLIGPGGAGKTRLAVEAAGRVPGSVGFAELASLTDGAELPGALLAALGLREAPLAGGTPTPPIDRLVTALTERPMLLVLDNCEHLVEPAARLAARLLGACPGLRVLATSREPLGITGETLYPVPALDLPPPGADPATALGFPAVRLFADRAAAGRAGFTVDETTVADVLRVCRALDGLPLAIELAAARVRTLPVAEVAARLGDRFALLSRGSRTAEARHRTLRAVVAWSWDLLDTGERELARRLTVFAGGATLDAAGEVCGTADTVDVLTGLADKSLVEVTGDRYRMLDTVRAFCTGQLGEAGEEDAVRQAHAEYFLAFAETADPHLRAAEQLEWMTRLDAEYDNLHAALRWAIGADVRIALRLVSALSMYWWIRGRRFEGSALSAELARRIGPEPPEGMGEEFVLCVLNASYDASAEAGLREHVAAIDRITETWDHPPRQPFVMVVWGMAMGPPGDELMLSKRREDLLGGDPWSLALDPFGRGLVELYQGNAAGAEPLLLAALERFRALGERWGTQLVVGPLGQLAGWRGDLAGALALYDEAIELTRQLGTSEDAADLFSQRADCRGRAGDLAGARADHERAAELARRSGSPEKLAVAHAGLAVVARLSGDLAGARKLCGQALDECPTGRFGPDEIRLSALIELARVACEEGGTGEARELLRPVLATSLARSNLVTAADAAGALAGVVLAEGDGEAATRLLGAAAALHRIDAPGDGTEAACRDAIGTDAFERAYAEGGSLSHADLLTLAGA
jgi:predicted ATPase/DNA-binding SARP family transcriptional activator